MHVALIGAGAIGLGAHLPALLRSPRVSRVSVADADPQALANAASTASDISTTTDVQSLLHSTSVDAVVLATPPWVTPDLVRSALKSGKYVLAEKPIAPTIERARELADMPEAYQRLQIGFTYRHHPAIERLQEVIGEGMLGSPLLVQVSLCDERADPVGDAKGFHRRLESLKHALPVVSDGVHACDRLNLLLGSSPLHISAWSLRSEASYASPNVNGAILHYRDGTVVRLEVIWLYPFLPPSQIVFTGPAGRAVVDPATFALRIDTRFQSEELPPPGEKVEVCFAKQLDRFLDCCVERRAPVPGMGDALRALELAEAIAEACLLEDRALS